MGPMNNTFTRRRGALLCQYELFKRQLRIKLSGVLTANVMPELAQDVNRIGVGALSKSIVLDSRGAVLALTYDDLLLAPDRLVPVLRILPVAIITTSGTSELFRDYAWAVAQIGLLRGVFPVEGPAQDWAGQQGRDGLCFQTGAPAPAPRRPMPVVPVE
jgi:hypothetical protein